MALFKSRSQRILKKARDMAADDMVDQAAVLIEEEIEGILEEKEVARQVVPFLMDIGHPDLAARLSERIIKAHSDLRPGVVKMLEEKMGQFSRSTELLKVLWRYRLRSKDYNGMLELLSTVDRLTESRFTDSIENGYNSLSRYPGDEIKNTEPCIAMAIVLYRKGRPGEAVNVLVNTAERSSFPDESLARLSGWIANRTGGADMEVNLGRIRILVALSDVERAISELSTLIQADRDTIEQAIAITEKSLVPGDATGKASVALARLMAAAGRINDACTVLEGLLDKEIEGNTFEQAAAGVVMAAPGSARANLLQARFRLSRGETTQGLESLTRVFECADLDQAPVAEVCRAVIDKGMDRDGKVTRKLGEFLVEKGTVEDAVLMVLYLLEQDPDWVFAQIQKLLQREKTNASVLILLAVYKLIAGREGEAGAALQHLASRKDLKSRSDIMAVLSRLSHIMDRFPRLRRFRASMSGGAGETRESAADWLALLLKGENVPDTGLLEIVDNGLAREKAQAVLDSGYSPGTPAGHLMRAVAAAALEDAATASPAMAEASTDPALAPRIAMLVSDMRLSMLNRTDTGSFLPALNDAGKGDVVAKLLPLLAEPGKRPEWMDALASRVDTGEPLSTAFFRLEYFIEEGRFGTAAVSVESIPIPEGPVADLAAGCRAAATGDRPLAVVLLSSAASDTGTAPLARRVLESLAGQERSGLTTLALAQSLVNSGDLPGAASVLSGSLDTPEVRDFLEETAPRFVDSWEINRSLALSRLLTGDLGGFRMAASTALEKSGEPAEELAAAALEHGSRKADPETILFGVSTSVRHSLKLEVNDAACRLIRMDPGLHPRLSVLGLDDPSVRALLGIASGDAGLFLAAGAPHGTDPPPAAVEECLDKWLEQQNHEAVHALIRTCEASGLRAQAHRARVALAGKGFSGIEGELFDDAVTDPGNRVDFWNSVESDQLLLKGLSEFLPPQAPIPPEEAGPVSRAIARSSLDGGTVLAFALRLAGSDDPQVSGCVSHLVDKALETPADKATPGFVRMLAAAGRTGEAFRFARGNDGLLAELRDALAGSRKSCPSAEDALWASGRRVAACAGWLAKYRESGDPLLLGRLHWALSQMGLTEERSALERLISQRHPDITEYGPDRGRAFTISDLLMYGRHTGRGMTNGR